MLSCKEILSENLPNAIPILSHSLNDLSPNNKNNNSNIESSISSLSSNGNSPILKKTNKKEDLMPAWFKEINEKYDTFCEKLNQVKHGQSQLELGLKEFDEKKKLLENMQKKQKSSKKTSIFSLNYHLITAIITFCGDLKGGYLKTLLRFSQINRYFYKLLQDDCIWRMVVHDYFGREIVSINERNCKEFYKTNAKNQSFWKVFVRSFFQSFEKFKKTIVYYKDCKCPQKIDLKSQQKDLQDALRFLQQNLMLFLCKTESLFQILFEDFAKKENLLRVLEALLYCKNYFIHSDTVDLLIYEIHRENSVKELLISRKFLQFHWSLCRNHEQDLLIFINTLIIPRFFAAENEKSFVLAETHYNFAVEREKNFNFSLNKRKNHENILKTALNKRFEHLKTVIYRRIADNYEVYPTEISIEEQGNVQISLEAFKISGTFDLKSANSYSKHEFLRNLAVGRLFFLKNTELIGYLSLFYRRIVKNYEKKLFLYASDANNETILCVLLD